MKSMIETHNHLGAELGFFWGCYWLVLVHLLVEFKYVISVGEVLCL